MLLRYFKYTKIERIHDTDELIKWAMNQNVGNKEMQVVIATITDFETMAKSRVIKLSIPYFIPALGWLVPCCYVLEDDFEQPYEILTSAIWEQLDVDLFNKVIDRTLAAMAYSNWGNNAILSDEQES